ncbi:aminotransferase class I/II-fold pyridoxal phosphate-dependent enzyme [Poseidonocella sp. HB161398]|uniref:aminotransferase class I/II-fold pyridoxal phosphate-dependent enzyme n=1 Tax=Poseidonocella sp. HB161398 TaxID=2320855 RepID=UPI0011085BB1|nr:aminotransferase class I/II-fold pyridoxal phosphate-dependent enzyme [Poseidonocella sp. HB161398]
MRVPVFCALGRQLDPERFLDALSAAGTGDAVLLHACCHNPAGADFGPADLAVLAGTLAAFGLVPLVGPAYLGFGEGVREDAAGLRLLLAAVPGLLALSRSKNSGLCRERTGAASHMASIARWQSSMPPAQGAEIGRLILSAPARVRELRKALQDGRPAAEIARQHGMCSLLPLAPDQVAELRERHAIHLPASGRIDIAGMSRDQVPILAEALRPLLRRGGARPMACRSGNTACRGRRARSPGSRIMARRGA